MLANVLKVGLGLVAGLALTPETKRKVGDAARAVVGDYRALARKEVDSLKRFWREEVEPLFEDEPSPRSTHCPPREASA